MNNHEAINVLFNEWRCIDRNDGIHCDRKCESCDLVMDVEIIREAYNMGISALEKQIPKKPYMNVIHYPYTSDLTTVHCPNCKRRLRTRRTQAKGDRFCPDCGQAIDWGKSGEV